MTGLRSLLSDVAGEVAPADLAPRVTAGLRRRTRRRRALVATMSVAVVVAGAGAWTVLRDGGTGRRIAQYTAAPGGIDVAYAVSFPTDGPENRHELRGQTPEGRPVRLPRFSGHLPMDLSPDGTRIAYGTSSGFAVLTITTGDVRRYPGVDGGYPVFSPDATELAFIRHEAGPAVLDLETGTVTPVDTPLTTQVAWSPDGELLAVSGPVDETRLVRRDGTVVRTLLGDLNSSHAWSPDGRHLLLGQLDSERPERIRVVDVRNGKVVAQLENARYVWRTDSSVVTRGGNEERPSIVERGLDGALLSVTPIFVNDEPWLIPESLRPAS